ncbi:MAG TPA: hypothetical protein VL154_10955 [Acetobacteraceae bacterium]|jgi:hypothetical protein|nr:hypothetical protein [Acetobacteraceae bacterium]
MNDTLSQALIAAAVALADTLARENAALLALDLPAAVALLADKHREADAFTTAHARVAAQEGAVEAPLRAMAETVGVRLAGLATENKRLLERALLVQQRVIGSIARAVPRALETAPRYDAGGGIAGAARPPPVALTAQA